MPTNRTATIAATHIATGATYYLTGFETVRIGYTRPTSTTSEAGAKQYSRTAATKNAARWAGDAYCANAFTDFRVVA